MTSPTPLARAAAAALLALVLTATPLAAQVREQPVSFDTAGRVMTLTPPLVARLALVPPAWPVTGDFLDARLYQVGEPATSFVIVVRRQREVLERFPVDAAGRNALADAIARGTGTAVAAGAMDSMPTFISEPVRTGFVVNQTMLGLTLFGPAAAAMISEPAASSAAYLAVAGGTFFYAAGLTQSTPVSRAQNHLSAHSAVRGAIAANLALYSLAGNAIDGQGVAAAIFVGGVLGDVMGFQLARPMTDAEAHGTAHGSTVSALTTYGVMGTLGAYNDRISDAMPRIASAVILGAGAAGYPLGLRYVRTSPYRVTAGDVGALFTAELLGLGAAATIIPESSSPQLGFGLLTAGYLGGAIVGDRLLVRKFDHTESDARLLGLGTTAGALMGIAVPVLADADSWRLYFGMATAGGILGAMATESFIKPARAHSRTDAGRRTGSSTRRVGGVDVSFSPQGALMAGSGIKGHHPLLSLSF